MQHLRSMLPRGAGIPFRVDTMVGVIYTYGLGDPESNTQEATRKFARLMVRLMRG